MKGRGCRGLAGALTAIAVAGCTTPPATSDGGSAPSRPGAAPLAITPPNAPLPPAPARLWADPGIDVDSYRVAGWGLVSMPALQRYLDGLYAAVKAAGGHPEWPGAVYILADPALRGTSTAAGNVFLSLGWLRTVESEDEMAALLAHEFGHVYLNHHAGNDVGNAADGVARLATLAWMIASRNVQATAMNGAYAISGVQAVGSNVAMPAWQRSQEEEADRFGAALALRQGYSYTQGFKLFLEHIDSYDADQRQQEDAAELAAGEAERQAAGRAAAEAALRQQGNPKNVSGLDKAWIDLQVKLAEGTADARGAIKRTVGQIKGKVTDNHDSAASREDALSQSILPLLAGKPRPAARVDAWQAALAQRDTALTLDHYALLPGLDAAIAAKHWPRARQLADTAASGSTANDALPLYYLQRVTSLVQPGQMVPDLPRRHLRAPERSWRFELLLASGLALRDRTQAKALVDEQFNYFHQAPPAWPELIAFYKDNGFNNEAKAMAQQCAQTLPSYRTACIHSAKTDAEKASEQAATDREAKRLSDKIIKPK